MTPQGRRAASQYRPHPRSPPQDRVAGIKLKAKQAALLRRPSSHARAHPPLRRRTCTCCAPVCVPHSLSSSFIPLPVVPSPLSFVPSANPTHRISISSLFPLSVAKKNNNKKKTPRTCVYPPAHAAGAGLSLHRAAQFDAGLCKEMLKSVR